LELHGMLPEYLSCLAGQIRLLGVLNANVVTPLLQGYLLDRLFDRWWWCSGASHPH
jgi:hypothetical protein